MRNSITSVAVTATTAAVTLPRRTVAVGGHAVAFSVLHWIAANDAVLCYVRHIVTAVADITAKMAATVAVAGCTGATGASRITTIATACACA